MRVGVPVLIIALAIIALTEPAPLAAQQVPRVFKIGILWPAKGAGFDTFLEGLRDAGYVEGKNVTIEPRWTGLSDFYRPDLARELVQLNVDLLVAAEVAAGRAAKEATSTIPIVVVTCDPFELLVSSLARPGSNVTGQTCMTAELTPKKLELLKEAVPRISQVAFLYNPSQPGPVLALTLAQKAAPSLHVTVHPVAVRGPGDVAPAFSRIQRESFDALFVYPDFVTAGQRKEIVAFAAKHRLPAIYGFRPWVDAGGLLSYGTSNPALIRRAAGYAVRILKGANPADLPVEQPTKFELVVNLKTAKALGLTIPQSVLIRADEVIQ